MTRAVPPIIPGVEMLSGSQPINGSLKFDEDHNTYLKITPGSNGNRRTWTWSGWVKRNTFGSFLMSRFFMGGTTSTNNSRKIWFLPGQIILANWFIIRTHYYKNNFFVILVGIILLLLLILHLHQTTELIDIN